MPTQALLSDVLWETTFHAHTPILRPCHLAARTEGRLRGQEVQWLQGQRWVLTSPRRHQHRHVMPCGSNTQVGGPETRESPTLAQLGQRFSPVPSRP